MAEREKLVEDHRVRLRDRDTTIAALVKALVTVEGRLRRLEEDNAVIQEDLHQNAEIATLRARVSVLELEEHESREELERQGRERTKHKEETAVLQEALARAEEEHARAEERLEESRAESQEKDRTVGGPP